MEGAMNVINERIEDKKGEVMDIMGNTVSNPGGNRPASWIRLILVLASVFSIILSIGWSDSASAADPLLHNSTNTSSTKWSSDGGWGVLNGKYGEFVCETCHVRMATNIKSIRSTITTPNNSKGTIPGEWTTIFFDRTSWTTLGVTGTMGDDSDTPRTSSSRICEVCHTYSTGQNGVTVHAYNSAGQNLGNHMQGNASDCTACHKHNVGFKPVACDTCHGMPPTLDVVTSTPGDGGLTTYDGKVTGSAAAGKHAVHAGLFGGVNSCDNCHKNYVMPQSSVVGGLTDKWDVSISFSNFGSTSGTYSGQTGVSYNQAEGTGGLTCSTVYCHGSTLDGVNTTPTWTGSTPACGDCHKATAAAPPTLGSHVRHAGSNAWGTPSKQGLGLACATCHGANGAGGAGHLDGKIQWGLWTTMAKIGTGATYSGTGAGTMNNIAPSGSYASCATIYCHSNAQGASGSGAPSSYNTPSWGGSDLTCGGCHANMSGGAGSGSHVKHASTYGFTCSRCHSGVGANTAAHANYSIDLVFSSQATGTGYSQDGTPGNGYGTCSTSYCHSNVQPSQWNTMTTGPLTYGTPTWGDTGSMGCADCHVDMSTTTDLTLGTHKRHTNSPADGVQYACSMCHGAGFAWNTVDLAKHANGNIDTSFTGQAAGTNYSQAGAGNNPAGNGYGTCSTSMCHGRATKNWGNSSVITLCEKCHGSAESIVPDNGFKDTSGNVGSQFAGTHKSHLLGIHNYREPLQCTECHIKPATVNDAGHMNGLPANLTWGTISIGAVTTGAPTFTPSFDSGGTRACSNTYCHTQGGAKQTPVWGDLGYGLSCGNCHGNPPSYPHPTGPSASNCHGCHFHVDTNNTSFVSSYRLIEGICANRFFTDETNCINSGSSWTSVGSNVAGNKIHIDGRMQVTKDECLGCHSNTGDYALIGQHSLHTDNDYFLSRQWDTVGGWGTATGGSTEKLVDASQSWTTDVLAGSYVRIASGPNIYKQAMILNNDTTSVTVWKTMTAMIWSTNVWNTAGGTWATIGLGTVDKGMRWDTTITAGTSFTIRTPKLLSNDDYDDPGWIYTITYQNGFPRYACGFCHPSDSGDHRNGAVNLDMDPTHSLPGTVKTKNWATNQFSQTESHVNVTCNAVYCHSNGYQDPGSSNYQYKTTPNWYAATPWASVDRCTQCHGNSPNTGGTAGSAAHAKHTVGIHYTDTYNGTNGKMAAGWSSLSGHGDGNSTTINCNMCHIATVGDYFNDKNSECSACHTAGQASGKGVAHVEADNTVHVDGNVDVVFISPLNLNTKAQLRDSITAVPTLDNSWTRTTGYKKLTPSVSHDASKGTPVYSAGTCSNTACHNQTPMQWNQAGPLQCMVCHLGLTK